MEPKLAEKEFLKDFIELYKSCPCLWNVNSSDYLNKRLKNQCYEELVNLLQTVEPNATKDLVVRKLHSLRAVFRKELRKVKASKKTVASPDLIYQPKLWYFDSMMFLCDQETDSDGDRTADSQGERELALLMLQRTPIEIVREEDLKLAKEPQKDFIKLYKSFPCLWNANSPEYTNKRLKNQCYEELLKVLQTVDPKATTVSVIRKINNIQSSVLAELKKVTPDIYQPKLWHFDRLMFIDNQETDSDENTGVGTNDGEEDKEAELREDGTAAKELEASSNSPPRKRKRSTPTNSEHMGDFLPKEQETSEGVFANFGRYVANSLKDIERKSSETCSIVRKLISDVIFEGESGTLRRASKIVTPSDEHLLLQIPKRAQPEANGPVIAPEKATPWRCSIESPEYTPTRVIENDQFPTQSFIET